MPHPPGRSLCSCCRLPLHVTISAFFSISWTNIFGLKTFSIDEPNIRRTLLLRSYIPNPGVMLLPDFMKESIHRFLTFKG